MKYTLITILLLITISGMAQKSKAQEWVDMQVFKKGDTAWVKGDTVEFSINTSVKFIKIGDAIYEIVRHSPTIEKYEPPQPVELWRGFTPTTTEIKY